MEDEIVAEIRRIRDQFAARFNHDLDAMYLYFKQREQESGRKYVNLVKRPKKRLPSRSRA
jgi:hypothetical protein